MSKNFQNLFYSVLACLEKKTKKQKNPELELGGVCGGGGETEEVRKHRMHGQNAESSLILP